MEQNNDSIELALKAANMAWWKMDLSNGEFTFGKRKAEMLGYPPGKFQHYKDFMSLVHPDDYENTMSAMQLHLDGTREKYEAEYRILTKYDGYKWMCDTGAIAKKDHKGNPLIVAGIVVDISLRKKTEESLKTSEIRYRRLFESAKDGILILDAETGMIMDVNPFLIEMLDYTVDQFLEKAIWELGFFKDIIASYDKFKELQQKEYVRYENLPLVTAHGRKINVEFVSNLYKENHQNVIQCNIRDITLRKRAEAAHLQSEERFRLILENSDDAIFMLDNKGRYIYSNNAAKEVLGFTEEEMIPKTFEEFMPANKQKEFQELFEEVLNNGKIYAEIELITKNGLPIPMDLNSVLLPNGFVYNSCKDITNRKETEILLKQRSVQLIEQNKEYLQLNKKLVQSNTQLLLAKEKAEENDSLKTAFLQNMSHEIRTPMNGILGFSELLKSPHLTGKEQQAYIQIIEQSGKRMLNIINDIINISKIETGQIELSIQATNVNELMRYLYTFFRPESKLKGLEFNCRMELSDQLSLIETDKTKLSQVLTNLLMNALKFTTTGSIDFGYTLRQEALEFFVKDTGIGIKKEMHEIVFDRFRQVDMSVARDFEGAGLGLTISRAFVKKLGGNIWLHSELGKGSSVFFTIPYRLSSLNHTEIRNKTARSGRLQNVKILVAEDDNNSMMLITKLLELEKADLYFAANGQEALDMVKIIPGLQIVLMDLKMPVMDGFKAIELIKQVKPELHIIAQSAYAFSNEQELARKSGCDDYIGKPIDLELLVEMINRHFENSQKD